MYDDTVIEGLVLIAPFLVVVVSSYYAYLMWARKLLTPATVGPQCPPIKIGTQRSTLLFADPKLSAPVDQRAGGSARTPAAAGKSSAVGDWLVPVIVWVIVIMMGLAIVGFLLGER